MSDVVAKELQWLWWGVIPVGKLTMFTGDPGLGKSFITIDVTARVSTSNRWPNDVKRCDGGSVILFAAEDDIEDTIRPRLDAAGADVTKVHAIRGVNVTDTATGKVSVWSFQLDRDLPILEAEMKRLLDEGEAVRLVVIDPISCYMGKADSHKNAEVRGVLSALAELAARYGVAILMVSHLNKSGTGKAVYRSSGSLGFAAAARSVWVVVKDLDDPKRRMMLPVKMNLCEEPAGLAYQITEDHIAWESEPVKMTGDEFLSKEADQARKPTDSDGSELQRAKEWVLDQLADGPVKSKVIEADAKECGVKVGTLKRALASLKESGEAKPTKDGKSGVWSWSLVGQETHVPASAFLAPLAPLAPLASVSPSLPKTIRNSVCGREGREQESQELQEAQEYQTGDGEHLASPDFDEVANLFGGRPA